MRLSNHLQSWQKKNKKQTLNELFEIQFVYIFKPCHYQSYEASEVTRFGTQELRKHESDMEFSLLIESGSIQNCIQFLILFFF